MAEENKDQKEPFDGVQGKKKTEKCPLCDVSEETIKRLKESANKKDKNQ